MLCWLLYASARHFWQPPKFENIENPDIKNIKHLQNLEHLFPTTPCITQFIAPGKLFPVLILHCNYILYTFPTAAIVPANSTVVTDSTVPTVPTTPTAPTTHSGSPKSLLFRFVTIFRQVFNRTNSYILLPTLTWGVCVKNQCDSNTFAVISNGLPLEITVLIPGGSFYSNMHL